MPKSVNEKRFTDQMYSLSLEKKEALTKRIKSYEKWLGELTKELEEVNEAIEFFKPRIKADSSDITDYNLPWYAKVEGADIKKHEEYEALSSWAEKVLFVMSEVGTQMSTDEIFALIMKYEGFVLDEQAAKKRVRNAIWSLVQSDKVTKIDKETPVKYKVNEFD